MVDEKVEAVPAEGAAEGEEAPVVGLKRLDPKTVCGLFFSNSTQQKFDLVIDTDVTEENPFKRISKQKVLDDIQFRGKISDWEPGRDKIKKIKTEEFLTVYDYDEFYGENFFFCITEESAEEVIRQWEEKNKPPEEEVPEEGEEAAAQEKRGPVSKEWVSQGSEFEIDELKVEQSRERLAIKLSRKRRQFKEVCTFGDREAGESYQEYRPFKDPNFDLKRMEMETPTQAIPDTVNIATQTTWFRQKNFTDQYTALDIEEEEKDDIVETPEFLGFLANVRDRYEEALEQNETVDIYVDDFAELAEEEVSFGNKADSVLKEMHSFTDIVYSRNKSISAIDWQPRSKGVVAVSCVERLDFDERVEESRKVRASYVLVWNFVDPIHPQFVLEAPADVVCLRFHPHKPELVAGGCYNGQVVLWDLSDEIARLKKRGKKSDDDDLNRKQDAPVVRHFLISLIENNHQSPVTDLCWLPNTEVTRQGQVLEKPNETQQFTTVGYDGHLLVWDIRNEDPKRKRRGKKEGEVHDPRELPWCPMFQGELQFGGRTSGATQLCIPKKLQHMEEGAPLNFFCASDEGNLLWCDFGGSKQEEVAAEAEGEAQEGQARSGTNNIARKLATGHTGPINSLQRSPFFPEILMTVGDRTFALWTEDCNDPIFVSPAAPCFLDCGRWSNSRPGIVFIGRTDGQVEIWDLTDQSHKPSMVLSGASGSITNMELNQAPGEHIAIGDVYGNCHVMELPRTLKRPIANEKSIMRAFFDREVKRVAYVAMRQEIRKEEKEVMERELAEKEKAIKEEDEVIDEAEKMEEKAEADYKKLEEAFRQKLGLDESGVPGGATAADGDATKGAADELAAEVDAPPAEEAAEAKPEGGEEVPPPEEAPEH